MQPTTTTINKRTIVEGYIANCNPSNWFGTICSNDVFYLECGREWKMPVKLEKTKDAERAMIHQVTIRDIQIADKCMKKGLFTEFIRYLLVEKKIVVCLEAVQPKWLKERLYASDLWILQTDEESKDQYPIYARAQGIAKDETVFRLF
jgi:hypothetical protein